jgi:predicted dehydrogenase
MKPLKPSSRNLNRRLFLQRTAVLAGLAGLPSLVPSSVLGAEGRTAPGSRLTLGCIGLGIQGTGNMRAFLNLPEVQVVAVCDVHEGRRAQGKQVVDGHYHSQDCGAVGDFRELVGRTDLDAVLICTPDHWHPLISLEAARQGKHMYCEKPIGWSVRAAQRVRQAIRERKVVFQFGTQQRSDARFRQACELVRNGKIGQLKTILVGVPGSWTCPVQPTEPVPKELNYDLWLGPAPLAPYCYQRCRPWTQKEGYSVWYSISDYCLGMIGNWGVHHLDIAQWGNNTELSGPVEIEGTGAFPKDMLTDCATNWQVENRFSNGVTLVHMDDATSKKHPLQVGGFGHGVAFLGTEGWIHVDRGQIVTHPESLLETKPGANDLRLFKSANHHTNFVDAAKGRTQPASPIESAVRVDTLCHLQQIAIRLQRKLRWDPAREIFPDDDQANAMLDRPMRAPWKLPA